MIWSADASLFNSLIGDFLSLLPRSFNSFYHLLYINTDAAQSIMRSIGIPKPSPTAKAYLLL